MLKRSFQSLLLVALTVSISASSAFSAPLGNWRFPFRLPVPIPLRIVERFRQKVPLRPEPTKVELAGLAWHTNYSSAWKQAKAEEKMLFVLFTSDQPNGYRQSVLDYLGKNEKLAGKLKREFVLAAIPTNQTITENGRRVPLIKHGSMQEMHGREGISLVDLKNVDQPYYGYVVSSYPFYQGKYYRFRAADLPVIADLPPGTITQRTMVWAVRVHPEHPASTTGSASLVLTKAAESHSHYQAQIGLQGHHQWENRFHRISGKLGGHAPVEVVAESWPNQTMIDSCVDCVASWRHSSGHWNAVKSYQKIYGYDIKKGSNGIWYGTGIFAR